MEGETEKDLEGDEILAEISRLKRENLLLRS